MWVGVDPPQTSMIFGRYVAAYAEMPILFTAAWLDVCTRLLHLMEGLGGGD